MVELLNSSRLKTYRACPRQHYLAYVQGYAPRAVAPALEFGTGMHEALAAWWTASRADAFAQALASLPAGWDPYVRARAEAMLAGYDAFWTLEGFEALEVERSFRLPLINPESGHPSRTWELGGTVDGIVRGADGRVWVLEHKTTSEDAGPGSAYRRRLAMDGQVSQYIEGAAALGGRFIAGRRVTLQDGQKGTLKDLPDLPTDIGAAATAAYIRDVMDGKKPIPSSIALQVEHILHLVKATEQHTRARGAPAP